jgi:hypoxanthine phosphoribosyltransferase
MALLTISGDPASRWEEVAHAAAQMLSFELVTESRIVSWIAQEFGDAAIQEKAWKPAAVSILTRMATEHHLVIALTGSEALFNPLPLMLRAGIVAPEARRAGNVMVDQRLERPAALETLATLDAEAKHLRKARVGRTVKTFDLVLNMEFLDAPQAAEILRAACCARRLVDYGLLSGAAAAQMQFQTRLQLAQHGISPAGQASLKRVAFGHPSEQIFANLLDFYRIEWDYEPRSFPLQWDKDGKVIEAFTPDFYLPELDLYVELTTMKQALVTKKNRKIKLLRAIYPHVNIQIFYQKDLQDLVFKHAH